MRIADRARRDPLRRMLLFVPLLVALLELSELDPEVALMLLLLEPLELLMPLELFMPFMPFAFVVLEPFMPFAFERLRSTSPPDVPDAPLLCALEPLDGMHVVDAVVPLDDAVLPSPAPAPPPVPLAPLVVFNPVKVLLGFVPVAPLTPLALLPLTPLVLPTLLLVAPPVLAAALAPVEPFVE